ncbi:MAG TPA: ABC transporter permease, partial [Cyclobacteriaceae bacterium]
MLKNYLKTAWRNLYKSKTFSLINVFGLALGLACSLLILLWVREERKMDAFHEHDAQLYSVFERQYHDGQIDAGHYTPGILADELKQTMAEVRYATGMAWNEENTFYANNKILKQEGNYAGEDFFKMFSYPLLQGDPETVLKSPLDVAITRKMAEDFFGSADAAYGQTIRYDNRKDMKITAVFENTPYNSSFQFDYILSWETFLENQSWARNWDNNGPHTFLMLQPGTDVAAFENKIRDFMDLHTENKNFVVRFGLQRFSEQYLHSNFENGEIAGGRVKYVRLFSVIAVFILLIACINFMNLTTARSVKRAKEIGIRKVAGAFRGALIRQFIGEALLIVV